MKASGYVREGCGLLVHHIEWDVDGQVAAASALSAWCQKFPNAIVLIECSATDAHYIATEMARLGAPALPLGDWRGEESVIAVGSSRTLLAKTALATLTWSFDRR